MLLINFKKMIFFENANISFQKFKRLLKLELRPYEQVFFHSQECDLNIEQENYIR